MTAHGFARRALAPLFIAGIMAGCAAAPTFPGTQPPAATIAPSPVEPPATAPGPTATSSAAATSSGTTKPALSSPAPIPEGDYVTGLITKAMGEAVLKEAGTKGKAEARQFVEGLGDGTRVTMRLRGGRLDLLIGLNPNDQEVGWKGTYAFADAQTLVANEIEFPCAYTYGFERRGESLVFRVLNDTCSDRDGGVAQRIIYESTPWTKKP